MENKRKLKTYTGKDMKIYNNYKYREKVVDNETFVKPYIITSSDYLNIYGISTLEDLEKLINDTEKNIINFSSYLKFSKLYNNWLKSNYNIVKKNSDYLLKIYLKIIDIIDKKKDYYKLLELEFKKFLNSWINKNNPEIFEFDFFNDFEDYILKKYNK